MGRVGAYPGAQHGCDSWLERMPTAGYSRSARSCRLHPAAYTPADQCLLGATPRNFTVEVLHV